MSVSFFIFVKVAMPFPCNGIGQFTWGRIDVRFEIYKSALPIFMLVFLSPISIYNVLSFIGNGLALVFNIVGIYSLLVSQLFYMCPS